MDSINPHDLLRDIIEQAVQLTAASSASLCLIEPDEGTLKIEVAVGITEEAQRCCQLRVGEGVTGWVAKHGKTLLVPDVCADERYVEVNPRVRSELAIPLIKDGVVIGVINVDSERVGAFQQGAVALLEMLARRCVDAIAYAHLYGEARQKNEQLSELIEAGRDLASTLELTEVSLGVVRHARRLLRGHGAALLLKREIQLEIVAVDGDDAEFNGEDEAVARVVRTGQATTSKAGLSQLVVAPLLSHGQVLGALVVQSAPTHTFRGHEIAFLNLLAQHSAVAIENASLFRQLREASEHLHASEKLAALGRLSAGLAHELRNPLNTLNVLLYAMSEPDSCSSEDLHVVRSEIGRMGVLLDQFLDFARPRNPEFRRERIEEVVEETLTLIAPEAASQAIRIERVWTEGTPAVWADGSQLKQVLLNLMLNALQSMESSGTLRVVVRSSGGSVIVEVQDDGPGILHELRDRLFEPFFTTRAGGTGLGLSIALRIVEAHSGSLRLDSEPGEGTTASLWLPA